MPRLAVASPLGTLVLTETAGRLTALGWDEAGDADEATPLLIEARRQLAAYFARRRKRFDLPLAPAGSAFERRVWEALERIPYGGTRSYGDIARELGAPARAIGTACGDNPIAIVIPCHRVLGADGTLVGYSGGAGPETKSRLLALEGALLL